MHWQLECISTHEVWGVSVCLRQHKIVRQRPGAQRLAAAAGQAPPPGRQRLRIWTRHFYNLKMWSTPHSIIKYVHQQLVRFKLLGSQQKASNEQQTRTKQQTTGGARLRTQLPGARRLPTVHQQHQLLLLPYAQAAPHLQALRRMGPRGTVW